MTGTTTFELNGQSVSPTHEPGEPLLHVLRNGLGLKGARFGCGLEQCGSCKVLVDGHAQPSCALEIELTAGRSVTTVEALAGDALGRALMQAFDAEQAGQCGYCLSGILVAAYALLKRQPDADRPSIVQALDDNLCRCGAHLRIIRAVERAAASFSGDGVRP